MNDERSQPETVECAGWLIVDEDGNWQIAGRGSDDGTSFRFDSPSSFREFLNDACSPDFAVNAAVYELQITVPRPSRVRLSVEIGPSQLPSCVDGVATLEFVERQEPEQEATEETETQDAAAAGDETPLPLLPPVQTEPPPNDGRPMREQIADYMRGRERVSPAEVARALNLNGGSVSVAMSTGEQFERIERGVYRLADAASDPDAASVRVASPPASVGNAKFGLQPESANGDQPDWAIKLRDKLEVKVTAAASAAALWAGLGINELLDLCGDHAWFDVTKRSIRLSDAGRAAIDDD